MEHFPEQVFADFVRGVDTPSRAELESHLAKGCQQCKEAVAVWKEVQEIATREKTYCPPEDVLRMVKLEFVAQRANSETSAKLVFDTLSQPALAGVRSAGTAAARQLVYEAQGMMIDLRFDHASRSNCISLIGQVLNQAAPRASLANAAVMLWTEKGLVLTETRTNGLGEFQLEFEAQSRLRLSIEVGSGTLIRIPLANLTPNQDAGSNTDGTDAGYR